MGPGPAGAGRPAGVRGFGGRRARGGAGGDGRAGRRRAGAIPERLREIQPGFDPDRLRCPQPANVTKNRRHGGWTGAGGGRAGPGRQAGPGRAGRPAGGGRPRRRARGGQAGAGPGLYLPLECAERDRIRTPGCGSGPETAQHRKPGAAAGIVGVVVLGGAGGVGGESLTGEREPAARAWTGR